MSNAKDKPGVHGLKLVPLTPKPVVAKAVSEPVVRTKAEEAALVRQYDRRLDAAGVPWLLDLIIHRQGESYTLAKFGGFRRKADFARDLRRKVVAAVRRELREFVARTKDHSYQSAAACDRASERDSWQFPEGRR